MIKKKKNTLHTTSKAERLCAGLFLLLAWIGTIITGFLAVCSAIMSAQFPADYLQTILYHIDPLWYSIPLLFLVICALYIVWRSNLAEKIMRLPLAWISLIYAIAISSAFLLLVRPRPVDDAAMVSNAVSAILAGDYTMLKTGFYLQTNQHQLGYAFLTEMLYRITGWQSYQLMQWVNVLCAGWIYYTMARVGSVVLKNNKTYFLYVIILFSCFPPLFCTVLIYGTLPGLAFALAAIYQTLLFLRSNKSKHLIYIVILVFLSISMRKNYTIFGIAILLLLLLHSIQQRKWQPLCTVVALIFVFSTSNIPFVIYYERLSGLTLGEPMPSALWVAMGLQDGPIASGWYNSFNDSTWVQSQYNADVSSQMAWQSFLGSIQKFIQHPIYTIRFFFQKVTSQWCEPTFDILRFSQAGSVALEPRSSFTQSLFYGTTNTIVKSWLNMHQSLIYTGAAIGLFHKRKKLSLQWMLLLLPVLGGFAFHCIWEAKSQYVWPYFLLLLPFAAVGLQQCCVYIHKLGLRFSKKQSNQA